LFAATPAASSSFPALLAPQVHAGEQLHYRSVVTRKRNAIPQLLGDMYSQSEFAYTESITDASPSGITWSRQATDGPTKGAIDSFLLAPNSAVVNKANGQPIDILSFAYNSALFGAPSDALAVGQHWAHSILHPLLSEYWTVTVTDVNQAQSSVKLHLTLERHASGFGVNATGEYWQDEREDGDVVFVDGVMTKLALQGRQTTIHKTFTELAAVDEETTLQDRLP
jgi:hypothetical protein